MQYGILVQERGGRRFNPATATSFLSARFTYGERYGYETRIHVCIWGTFDPVQIPPSPPAIILTYCKYNQNGVAHQCAPTPALASFRCVDCPLVAKDSVRALDPYFRRRCWFSTSARVRRTAHLVGTRHDSNGVRLVASASQARRSSLAYNPTSVSNDRSQRRLITIAHRIVGQASSGGMAPKGASVVGGLRGAPLGSI
jgi:hypothetical protein